MSRRPEGMPWSKFWWKDYDRDPALRRCSLEAEGLWMRILCIMADAEPYGYLLVEGTVPDNSEIARMVGRGLTERRVGKLMAELQLRRVYSVDERSVPFCRRMVREAKVRAEAQFNGAKGGNPALTGGGRTTNMPRNPEGNTKNISGQSEAPPCNISGLGSARVNPPANPPVKLQEERGDNLDTGSLRSPVEGAAGDGWVSGDLTAAVNAATPEAASEASTPDDPFGAGLFGDDLPPPKPTPNALLHEHGARLLAQMLGKDIRAPKQRDALMAQLGLLKKDARDDAAAVLEAIEEAHRRWRSRDTELAKPFPWLRARLRPRAQSPAPVADRQVPKEVADRNVSAVVAYCEETTRVCYDGLWSKYGSEHEFSLLIAEALAAGKLPEKEIRTVMRDVFRRSDKADLGPAWFRAALGIRGARPALSVVKAA